MSQSFGGGGRSPGPPSRLVIEHLAPEIEGGRFATKAVLGDELEIEADAFADGHDIVACVVRTRVGGGSWRSVPMQAVGNDRFRATLVAEELGRLEFEVRARLDAYRTWLGALRARASAGADTSAERSAGAAALEQLAARPKGRAELFKTAAVALADPAVSLTEIDLDALASAVDEATPDSAWTASDRRAIVVDRARARFGAWYEVFPRSTGVAGRHGTFASTERRLDYIEALGFDIVYLPPIHPIGETARKGPRGGPPEENSPGSPWAIGSRDGGHTAVHRELGTLEDFDHLVFAARARGLEMALDYALQCSPDHPWVGEHPEWFRHRPDGSIACAENPPKRYEDVYPLDFESDAWRSLWLACKEVLDFWIAHGVRIFRVDNPHTKPFAFWEWLIGETTEAHPDVLFLAEAFTRPRPMEQLAALGFSQSYTYFTWRRSADELRAYVGELATAPMKAFFRPNAWPNTPDILVAPLAGGPLGAFAVRAVLAATLFPNWGIYGPCFEQGESRARDDAEEYAVSDKYEIRSYDFDVRAGIAPLVAQLNAIRHSEVALQHLDNVTFHSSDNPELLVYSKSPPQRSGADTLLCVVNLDASHRQSGWVTVDLGAIGLSPGAALELKDLLSGESFRWAPGANFVILDPAKQPAHLFSVRPER